MWKLFGHPGVMQNLLQCDSLFHGNEHLLDEVFDFAGKFLGLRDYLNKIVLLKLNSIFLTFSMISLSFSPSKGGAAVTRI